MEDSPSCFAISSGILRFRGFKARELLIGAFICLWRLETFGAFGYLEKYAFDV
jgi:hypothetical protein